MFVTSGAMFGPAFDEDDVLLEDWGTLTFTFSSCNEGSVEYDSTMAGFGSGAGDIERLTSVTGMSCP